MTEAAASVLQYGFEELHLEEIVTKCVVIALWIENSTSLVMIKMIKVNSSLILFSL
jgi:hypothetical protein